MIDVRSVLDVVLVQLRSTDLPVGDAGPPAGDPRVYGILELGPGTARLGTVAAPERAATVRLRIRVVARSNNEAAARAAAQHLAGQLGALLLERTVPLQGEGWEVSGRRHISDSGTMVDGELVNQVDDYELDVWA